MRGFSPKRVLVIVGISPLLVLMLTIPAINDGVSTLYPPALDKGGRAGFGLCAQDSIIVHCRDHLGDCLLISVRVRPKFHPPIGGRVPTSQKVRLF